MFRFVLVLLALLLVAVLAGEADTPNPVKKLFSLEQLDLRSWLLGGEIPKLEAQMEQLQTTTRQENVALHAQLAELERQIQALQTLNQQVQSLSGLTTRLEAVESGTQQLRMENGVVIAKQEDQAWQLTNIFSRTREFRLRVEFAKPFAQPPKVVMGIVMLDFNQDKIHFQSTPEAIDTKGFTALFSTRAEERPREVRVEWLAYGE